LNPSRDCFATFRVEIRYENERAFLGKHLGNRPSNAISRSRYDGNFIF
jgi:hypothetical protein